MKIKPIENEVNFRKFLILYTFRESINENKRLVIHGKYIYHLKRFLRLTTGDDTIHDNGKISLTPDWDINFNDITYRYYLETTTMRIESVLYTIKYIKELCEIFEKVDGVLRNPQTNNLFSLYRQFIFRNL